MKKQNVRNIPDQGNVVTGQVLTRRAIVAGLPLLLAGCAGANYGTMSDGGFTTPAIDVTTLDPSLMRVEVAWRGKEKPGSIVVNVPQRRLYLVESGSAGPRVRISAAARSSAARRNGRTGLQRPT
jgi:lipoprotein-anchoring transpeptidase ErfK/SrfK